MSTEVAKRLDWDIPTEAVSYIPRRLLQIMAKGNDKDTISAAKVLVGMMDQSGIMIMDDEPVTAENIDEYKTRLLEALDNRGRNAG